MVRWSVDTRERVAELVDAGMGTNEIARQLGLARSTVCYHRSRLGLEMNTACNRRYDWDEVQRYYDDGHSARACIEHFGFAPATWHDAATRGALKTRPPAAPIERYLVNGRRVNRAHLKRRLVEAGLKELCCEECGVEDWRDRPLSMALHHVNGNGDDNRLDNLMLLCPNCHSQTPNFSARNRGRPSLPTGATWIRNLPHGRRLPRLGLRVS